MIPINLPLVGGGQFYSTSEQVVGTWIDGKPIYQKTIDYGNLPNKTTKDVSFDGSEIDLIIDYFGVAYDNRGTTSYRFRSLPYPQISTQYTLELEIRYSIVRISTNFDASPTKAYVTLQYTKLTD